MVKVGFGKDRKYRFGCSLLFYNKIPSLLDPFYDSDDSRDLIYKPSESEESDFDPGYVEYTPPRQNQFSDTRDSESDSNTEESPDFDENQDDDANNTTVDNANNNQKATLDSGQFGPVKGNHKNFPYSTTGGINEALIALLGDGSPYDFYSVFIDDNIFTRIANETNLYAMQCLTDESKDTPIHSRKHAWNPTTKEEIKQLFGLLGYMGIVKMSCMRDYWSTDTFYSNKVCPAIMPRNRFELLLTMLHFENNEEPGSTTNRLHKIQGLVDQFVQNSQIAVTLDEVFCIDETLIPFRGRVIMRQYIPQKAHKYGIKVFKFCCNDGYTWNMKIYSRKEADSRQSIPTNIVMQLSEKLLNCGRTVVTDNYYTSLSLANQLLQKNTHLVGTLRRNRKGNPQTVVGKKLRRGELVAEENVDGITIMKWKDKRDVLMLSTKHTDECVTLAKKGKQVTKPKMVIDYNKGKTSIDISDQFSSYGCALRKTIKWYKKVAIEIILGTAIVNAHYCYKKITGNVISIRKFRESVIKCLLSGTSDTEPEGRPAVMLNERLRNHSFNNLPGLARVGRKYCKGCYKKKSANLIPKSKIRKVTAYCNDCEGQPRYCLECFNTTHNIE